MSSCGITSKALIYGGEMLTNNLPPLFMLHIIVTEYTLDVKDINNSNTLKSDRALTAAF